MMTARKLAPTIHDWMPTITATVVTIGFLAQIWLQIATRMEVAATAQAAAIKTEEVKEALEVVDAQTKGSLADLKQTGESTHTLVNANMGAQLKISALALRRVAELTKHTDDQAAAELAEKLLKEHDDKQKRVDERSR